MAKRLIIGCGYLGHRLARTWLSQGDDVQALTRSASTAQEWESSGLKPIVGDVLKPDTLAELPSVDTLLYAVGYDRQAGPSKRAVYVDGLRNVLAAVDGQCRRIIYISSTSVYGQSQGEWVDETSLCEPTSEGGRICLDAECLLHEAAGQFDHAAILRLSGIYGSGRLAARVEHIRAQLPIAGSPDGWLNLIHVDDAVRSIRTVAERETPPEMLLVSDDRPLRRQTYYGALTQALAIPPPVFAEDAVTTDIGKRCSNRRLRQELHVELCYPSIDDGLPTALSTSSDP